MEEALEGLRLVELAEQPQTLLLRDLGRRGLGVLLNPQLLVRLLDVHVLDPGRTAIRITEETEDLAERHSRPACQAARGERALEVPHAEPVGERVELGMDLRRVLPQRVEVGDQVAAHAVHVDELEDPGLLLGPCLAARRRVGVDRPARRDVGDLHRSEDLVVEAVFAQ